MCVFLNLKAIRHDINQIGKVIGFGNIMADATFSGCHCSKEMDFSGTVGICYGHFMHFKAQLDKITPSVMPMLVMLSHINFIIVVGIYNYFKINDFLNLFFCHNVAFKVNSEKSGFNRISMVGKNNVFSYSYKEIEKE